MYYVINWKNGMMKHGEADSYADAQNYAEAQNQGCLFTIEEYDSYENYLMNI